MEQNRRLQTRQRRISVFDGQDFRKAMLAATAWLEQHREAINALNVFPVPDGDTGSNMSATMRAASKQIEPLTEANAGVVAHALAQGAIMGARGNSGVILSQILRGLADGLHGKKTFSAADLAAALQKSSTMAYRAVLKPVEGTILTVVRDAAAAAASACAESDDILHLLQCTVTAARQSVARTPELLPTLKQAGVVDSGGQGLATILEGIFRYSRGDSSPMAVESQTVSKGRVTIEEEFGYEVVFLLRGEDMDVEKIRDTINQMGASTVVGGDTTLLKVHTHTEWPGKVLDYGVTLGSLTDINIENLQEQSLRYASEGKAEREGNLMAEATREPEQREIATVAVVSGPGFEEVYKSLGVGAIVSGGQSMNPSTEELLAAVNAAPADKVILLPNNSNVILSAQQVLQLTSKQVHIIPTDTMPQGIVALLAFNYGNDFDTNAQAMSEAAAHMQTAEITTAVRSVHLDGLRVREGDLIGMLNGKLVAVGPDTQSVIWQTLERMQAKNYELFTLYYGEGVNHSEAQAMAQAIKERYAEQEIEVVDGGQPYYAYVISAE